MTTPQTSRPSSTVPSLRTGAEYLRSLNDGRQIFVDGEKVADVTKHPAFREAARSVARLYDIAAAPEMRDRMTFPSPKTGEPVLRAFQIPKSHADLKARRLFSETWAEATFGLMGRTPDHVAGFFAGYAARADVLAAGGQKYADNVVAFYEHIRDNHLYVAYAIVPPQIDRSKPAHQQKDPTLYAGVVKERDDGIVISGAQQLATAGVFADYLHLSCIHPLRPGDEAYANGVVIPINTPGPKLYPRRAFANARTNSFDYPLTSRFDETDCFCVFDNVFVPWESVYIYRNLQICWDQWWKTPAHLYGNHQAQCRYAVKLRFMLGLAKRMNEMTGNDSHQAVQVEMGELAGAAMTTLPTSARDFDNPEIARDIEKYMQSATTAARERVALLRMAWDFIGTEFGSRHAQYEKFYGGASFLVKQNVNRFYDYKRATALVDAAMGLPPVNR